MKYILDNRVWNMPHIVRIDLTLQLIKVSSRHGISVIIPCFHECEKSKEKLLCFYYRCGAWTQAKLLKLSS